MVLAGSGRDRNPGIDSLWPNHTLREITSFIYDYYSNKLLKWHYLCARPSFTCSLWYLMTSFRNWSMLGPRAISKSRLMKFFSLLTNLRWASVFTCWNTHTQNSHTSRLTFFNLKKRRHLNANKVTCEMFNWRFHRTVPPFSNSCSRSVDHNIVVTVPTSKRPSTTVTEVGLMLTGYSIDIGWQIINLW